MSSFAVLALHNKSQLHHVIPIALALIREGEDVTIFTSTRESKNYILNLAMLFKPIIFPEIITLKTNMFNRIKDQIKERMYPRASLVIKHNLKLLSSYDAIITPDVDAKPFHSLKKRPKLIFTMHGTGLNKFVLGIPWRLFDYSLLYGNKLYSELDRLRLIPKLNCEVIGSPKFELSSMHPYIRKEVLFPDSNRPIVLYNPHFNKPLSSWHLWSDRLLSFFANNSDYNVIFAPHVLLNEKEEVVIHHDVILAENIFIDLESDALFDMTYTRLADIYVGDVSSQVYEFLHLRSRPCIFLNPRKFKWQGTNEFHSWKFGPVIDDFDYFPKTLNSVAKHPSKYAAIQEREVKSMLYDGEVSASERAARAIINFIHPK